MADKPFQYIQTLLEAGSFSRAAKRLNISQPSLSLSSSCVSKKTSALRWLTAWQSPCG
ncbi:MAG: LysR family transcriptional regulator [Mesosutterella multiformis]|nr:LysR family transcriptional regulator [Mesosutterella multiformis]